MRVEKDNEINYLIIQDGGSVYQITENQLHGRSSKRDKNLWSF